MRLAVYFDFDSYSLSKNSFEVLNAVVAHLKLNEKVHCILYGYTDQEGPMEYNQRLSISRANTARNYLMSYGIDGNRILVESFGKAKAAAPNTETYLAWKNRRVEIILIK
jgi:peptidoglycan-associated lipoprotein